MTYHDVAHFAQTWGMLLFVAVFAVVVIYALWPSNKRGFDEAARIPLLDDKPDPGHPLRPAKKDTP